MLNIFPFKISTKDISGLENGNPTALYVKYYPQQRCPIVAQQPVPHRGLEGTSDLMAGEDSSAEWRGT